MRQIIILDPGLSELGGHHPATIEALNQSKDVQTASLVIDAFISQNCHSELIQYFNKGQVNLKPHFKTVFYQNFYQSSPFTDNRSYIETLSKEYYQAIKKSIESYPQTPLLFWCHTVAWQHAYALALTIAKLTKENNDWYNYCALAVGLMFGSQPYNSNKKIDLWRKQLNVEMSFRFLSKQKKVSFFAADYELQQKYTAWLNTPVSLQPNLLLGEVIEQGIQTKKGASPVKALKSTNRKSILFYAGDAKINKGFTQLPGQLKNLLPKFPDVEFVVQFTLNNHDDNLICVKEQLVVMQNKFSNVRLIDTFIEHRELLRLFEQSHAIVFNYDENIYQQQSSGLFWLSAYFGLPSICLTHTWINREALRLGIHLIESQPKQLEYALRHFFSALPLKSIAVFKSNDKDIPTAMLNRKDFNTTHYRQEIFQDLTSWLAQCHKTLLTHSNAIAMEPLS